VLPAIASVLAPVAEIIAMVKPQFEVGKGEVGKGGVVREPEKRAAAVRRVRDAAEALGFTVTGEADAVIAGPKGNQETFLRLTRGG